MRGKVRTGIKAKRVSEREKGEKKRRKQPSGSSSHDESHFGFRTQV